MDRQTCSGWPNPGVSITAVTARAASTGSWPMRKRRIGSTRIILRSMLSAEAWTLPRCGYPDLLATGELCNGDSIHDRQHPHDVLMELSAAYDRPITGSTRLRIYGGPSGEPALGPPAYLHRPSSGGNPIAPIAHHWLDSTHIS